MRQKETEETSQQRGGMAIIYIMGLSFLVARIITHHPEPKWHVMWRLLSEVTVVAVQHFFFFFYHVFDSHSEEKDSIK